MKIDKRLKRQVEQYVKESVSQDGKLVDNKVKGFTEVLKSLPCPVAIATLGEYLKRLKNEVAKSTLEIESAVALSPVQLKQVIRVIKAKHTIVAVKTSLDTSLLGGVKIKIGDVVYDDTLGQKIASLKGVISG